MTVESRGRADSGGISNIVLVHGAFVDGSGWEGVHRILHSKGFKVTIVQHPTASLAEDVAYVARAIAAQDGPVVLVGHSYGGVVITEAGRDSRVEALVYIAGWVPDSGQSVSSLIGNLPAGGPSPPVLPPKDGFIFVDPERFPQYFAQDVDGAKAEFMAVSQAPWGLEAANGSVGRPAWKTKPSWYLVARDDRMIPPDAQRAMAAHAGASVTEVAGSHAVFLSDPESTAALIERAAAMRGDDRKTGREEEKRYAPGVIVHVTDQGATSPDPVPCDLDLEPSSALGGGSSTRSNTASTPIPDESGR